MADQSYKIKVSEQGIKSVNKGFGKMNKKTSAVTGAVKKLAIAVGGLAAAKKAIEFTTGAAIEQEKIFRKLQTQVELSGKSWKSAKGELDGMFKSLQATTEYGDTDSAEALQKLLTFTDDYAGATENLSLVLDMASTGLFDTNTAARYVGMALAGNVEMLGRYVPELKTTNNEQLKTMTTAEKTAFAMELLNEKFGGAAQENLETTSGQYKQMKNYLGDIGEAIGDKTLPALNSLLGSTTEFFNKLSETTLETSVRQLREMGVAAENLIKYQIEIKRQDYAAQLFKSTQSLKTEFKNISSLLGSDIVNALGQVYKEYKDTQFLGTAHVDVLKEGVENVNLEKMSVKALNEQRKKLLDQVNKKLESGVNATSSEVMKLWEKRKALTSILELYKTREEIQQRLKNVEDVPTEQSDESEAPEIPKVPHDFSDDIADLSVSLAEIEANFHVFKPIVSDLGELSKMEIPDEILELANRETEPPPIFPQKDLAAIQAGERFASQLSSNMAQAVIHGQDMGDAVVSSLKAIAAELAAKAATFAILNTITGGGFGASEKVGGFLSYVFGLEKGGYPQSPKYMADGGFTSFIPRNRDTEPAMLRQDELVMNQGMQTQLLDYLKGRDKPQGGQSMVINVNGDFIGTEENADRLAEIIADRSTNNQNRIAVKY